jgi:hypothetical protein
MSEKFTLKGFLCITVVYFENSLFHNSKEDFSTKDQYRQSLNKYVHKLTLNPFSVQCLIVKLKVSTSCTLSMATMCVYRFFGKVAIAWFQWA